MTATMIVVIDAIVDSKKGFTWGKNNNTQQAHGKFPMNWTYLKEPPLRLNGQD